MDLKKISAKFSVFVKKYRYVAIILLVGLVLMCLPNKSTSEDRATVNEEYPSHVEEIPALDESLSGILSHIKGAGNVRVLLTLQRGEETVYQTDSHTSVSSDTNTAQIETVIISGSERNQSGLVKQVNPPTYMGAIVVCQGADSPTVRLAIVEAVSKVTGLGADRISVLKMK